MAGRLRLLQLPRLRPRARDHRPDRPGPAPAGAPTRAGPGCSATRAIYLEIEEQLTELLGAPDTLVLPTITHIHIRAADRRHWSGTATSSSRRARPTRPSTTAASSPAAWAPPLQPLPRRRSGGRWPELLRTTPAGGTQDDLHGRRQQHDRQRARPGRLRRDRAGARRPALRRRRARLRRDRRARVRPRAVAVRGPGQQHRPARCRDVRQASCWSAGSPRPTPRCWPSSRCRRR